MLRWLIVALLLVCPVTALAANDYQIDVTWQLDKFETNESAEHWNTWSTAAGWTSLRAMFMESEQRTVTDKGLVNVRSDMGVPSQIAPITLTSGLNYTQTEQGSPQGSTYADRGVPFWQFSNGTEVLSGGSLAGVTTTPLVASHIYHAGIDIDDAAAINFRVVQNDEPGDVLLTGDAAVLKPSFWYDATLTLVPGDTEIPPTYKVNITVYPTGGTTGTKLVDNLVIDAKDLETAYIKSEISGADAKLSYWIDSDTAKAITTDLPRWEFVQSTQTPDGTAVDPEPLFTLTLRPTLSQASIFVTHTGPLGKLRGVKIQQTLSAAKFTTPWSPEGETLVSTEWLDSDFAATPKTSTAATTGWTPTIGSTWTILSDAITNPVAKEGHVYKTINTLP